MPKLGSYVKTGRHGHEGRVIGKDHLLAEASGLGGDGDSWFAGQRPPLPEECKDNPGTIYSVKMVARYVFRNLMLKR